MTDLLRLNRGWLLGSWRWPFGAVLALVVAVLAAFAEAWLTAFIFLAISLTLWGLTIALRRRRS
jgi:hypothetical protein